MSYLDKRVLLKANLETRSITEEKQSEIFFYNTDENIANLYMKLIYVTDDGLSKELQKDEVSGYSLKMTAIKPKTNQIREVDGVLSEDLINNEGTCAIFKFQLGTEFTNQIGDVICCTKIIKDAQKLNMDYFVYTIKADKLTGLNAEITSNPDLPVLKQLIKEVKETAQTVNNIDDVNITDTKTFSNKKIEEKFTDVDSQIKEIAKVSDLGQDGNNIYIKDSNGNKIGNGVTVQISGTEVGMSSVIDLVKYNITQADYEYPFTTENYRVAHQNGVGLQQAINEAKEKGISELVLPPGNYPLCYSTDNYQTINNIILANGINLKGYGCKLYVIYDELDTGLNPYYTGDPTLAHAMCGRVIDTDSSVEGFEIVGERKYRTTDNAKYREFSHGIGLTKYTNGNKIKNCNIHHFSGDAIGGSEIMQQVGTWMEGADALATSITWNGTKWVQSDISYTSPKHSIGWADITKPFQCRGSLYFIWTASPLKIHCFKGIQQSDKTYIEGDYIGTIRVNQGEPFYFLKDTYYWYLEVTSGTKHDVTSTTQLGIALGYGTYYNTTIEGCECYLNTRGGVSNLPSGSTVKNCRIYNNGGAFDGMVGFYDGTQFGIDIEDWYIHSITIDNCLIFNNLHGILYRCHGIKIINSVVYGITNSLNYAVDFYAENTQFKGECTMTTPANFGSKIAIGCKFDGNVAPEIDIIDNSDNIKSATIDDQGMLSFYNKKGLLVFDLDMSKQLGIKKTCVSQGLCLHYDFTETPVDPTTVYDKVNNLSIYNSGYTADNYTSNGVYLVNGGGANSFKFGSSSVSQNSYQTMSEFTSFLNKVKEGNGLTIEYFGQYLPMYLFYAYNTGIVVECSNATSGGYLTSFGSLGAAKLYYINTSNGSTSVSLLQTNSVTKDGTIINAYSVDNKADTYIHLVITADETGKLTWYLNGNPMTNTTTVTDFSSWDYDTMFKSNYYCMLVRAGTEDTNRLIYPTTSLRVYNKALTQDEINTNLEYEVSRTDFINSASVTP